MGIGVLRRDNLARMSVGVLQTRSFILLKFYSKHPHTSAKTVSSTFSIFAVLVGAAVPHLERGIAALKWPLEGKGYLYLSLSFTTALSSSPTAQFDRIAASAHLSPPLVLFKLPNIPCDFTIKTWEKRLQNSIREIHWFPKSKSIWFTFWPAVVFVTLGFWLLAG
jgi:hypothetical protein